MLMRVLGPIVLLSKEVGECYRFFYKAQREEKRIVFYAEHESYYSYFEGIINELIDKHKQMLCYVTSDPSDRVLKETDPGIRSFYINKLIPFFMAFVNCKVFVMTLTDLNQSYIKRSVNPVHYVYMFHALVSTHMIYRHGAFDHYDSVLCCGPHHIQEIRRQEELSELRPKKLVEAGYFRLERIYDAYRGFSDKKRISRDGKTILIAPSWGDANILECCGEHLVEVLLGAGFKVIVRPHPETIRRSPNLVTLLSSRFGNDKDFELETSVATDDSLLRSDLLISDYSGIALEYAFGTERPVLFLDVPPKVKNQAFKALDIEPLELFVRDKIGVVISPENLKSIPEVISSLMADRAVFRRRIVELRRQNVYAFGHSAEIGAQYIVDLASGQNSG